jgi:hypothetical protein
MAAPEQEAMAAAANAAMKIITASKNPRTVLGRMPPTAVAFHAAWAAVNAHRRALEDRTVGDYRKAHPGQPYKAR